MEPYDNFVYVFFVCLFVFETKKIKKKKKTNSQLIFHVINCCPDLQNENSSGKNEDKFKNLYKNDGKITNKRWQENIFLNDERIN